MPATQQNREISVQCALGEDVLLFRHMVAFEQLSCLSEYNLELLSEQNDLAIDALLGTQLTVKVQLPNSEGERYFDGFITHFALAGKRGRYAVYQAVVHPWLWFLTRTAGCRIFQNLSVPDILNKVFEDYTVVDLDRSRLTGDYPELVYCVQYRETDFNFVSRLMEQAGIYYYFQCQEGRHTLVLADAISAHETFSDYPQLPYHPLEDARHEGEVVFAWQQQGSIQSGSYSLRAFDFEKPSASNAGSLQVVSLEQVEHEHGRYEVFDFPGKFTERPVGETQAKVQLQALHAKRQQIHGGSNARGLFPGGLFSLIEHPRADQNMQVLVTSARYVLHSDAYETTPPLQPEPPVICHFEAIPATQAFRPPCITPKPIIQGPQTAMVVGKAGEEIWTDQYGRIKVQFHWGNWNGDYPEDETSSCWIRVAHNWAGKRWGTLFIPRIGQEVVVSFLEGDPDQPLVTGAVYNADNMPPYGLPENATRSTLKTNSSKGGAGYNELRFEDKKDSEQLFMHAQKDLDCRVENDSREWVGNNRHLVVEQNRYEHIKGALHTEVAGNHNAKVGGSYSQDVSNKIQLKAGSQYALEAGMDVHIKAGMNLVIEAGMSITLKAGGGFVVIGPTSVVVTGTPILLNSGGSAGSGAGSSPSAPEAAEEAKD